METFTEAVKRLQDKAANVERLQKQLDETATILRCHKPEEDDSGCGCHGASAVELAYDANERISALKEERDTLLGQVEWITQENKGLREGHIPRMVEAQLEMFKMENACLKAAIAEHHAQSSDDRCFLDDSKLYEAAGLPPHDCRVGDKEEMLKNCARFIERRCEKGGWPTYKELEEKIKNLLDLIEREYRQRGHDENCRFYHYSCNCSRADIVKVLTENGRNIQ